MLIVHHELNFAVFLYMNSGNSRNKACEDTSDQQNHARKNQEESEGHEKVKFKYFLASQIEITLFLTFMILILFYLVSGSSHGGCY